MWRSPSPPHKCIKNTCAHETTHTEHLLNTGRRPQTSKKASQSPQNEVVKAKDKRDKGLEQDLHPGASHEGGKVSAHLDTPRVGTGELLRPSRIMQHQVLGRQNRENSPEMLPATSQPRSSLHTHHGKRGLGAED